MGNNNNGIIGLDVAETDKKICLTVVQRAWLEYRCIWQYKILTLSKNWSVSTKWLYAIFLLSPIVIGHKDSLKTTG